MKELARNIDPKTSAGIVKLEANDAEDMWQAYNLLVVGDLLHASTFRKVSKESSTGTVTADKIHLSLAIKVGSVDFDPAACQIRVSGKVARENQHVAIGAFHTIDLEPNRAFSITKESWDNVYLQQLNAALDPSVDADLGAIIMEAGLAHVLLVSRSLTITLAKVKTSIPRKGVNKLYNRDSAMKKFYQEVMKEVVEKLNLDKLKVLLIGSPGFVRDAFYEHMMLEAARMDMPVFTKNKSKIVLTHCASGHKHCLNDILQNPKLQTRLAATKAVADVQVFANFNDMMAKDPDRAIYGPGYVHYALELGAVDKMLITDKQFRSNDIPTRKKYIKLVKDAEEAGAKVSIFSTQHETGLQLEAMSGVAAILRFPLVELNEMDPPIF